MIIQIFIIIKRFTLKRLKNVLYPFTLNHAINFKCKLFVSNH